MTPDKPGIICVLIGLPASGKSTLCEWLCGRLCQNYSILRVCYDSILNDRNAWHRPDYRLESISLRIELVTDRGTKLVYFVQQYGFYCMHCKCILCRMRIDSNLCSWKTDRLKPLQYIRNFFEKDQSNFDGDYLDFVVQASKAWNDGQKKICILVDDNMYYKSMRYPYYQLAREWRLGYCQIYLDIPAHFAVDRDNERLPSAKVGSTVIERICNRMQIPNICDSWQKHSLKFNFPFALDEDVHKIIDHLFCSAICDPPPTVTEHSVQDKELNREITRSNKTHQLDLIFRESVKDCAMAGMDGKLLARAKSELLNKFKTGILEVGNLHMEREALKKLVADMVKEC